MPVAEKHSRHKVQPPRSGRDDFRKLAVRLSTRHQYALGQQERDLLISAVSAMMGRLETDLADGASELRRGVRSYVFTMSGSQAGELQGSGVILKDPKSGKVLVELKSGEVDAPGGAEAKVSQMTAACIALAQEDLAFLKKTSQQLQSVSRIGTADLETLRSIIDKNSYHRCLEGT